MTENVRELTAALDRRADGERSEVPGSQEPDESGQQ